MGGTYTISTASKYQRQLAVLAQALSSKQDENRNLEDLAELAISSFGEEFLTLVDAAAARRKLQLGAIATKDAITYFDVGGDPAGAAATVNTQLQSHVGDASNPHNVTPAQIGAELAGAAATVNSQLQTHVKDATNPHKVTPNQIGAEIAGAAAAVSGQLQAHVGNTSNPHAVTPSQIGAASIDQLNAVMQKAYAWSIVAGY
jgi:hypothetical protein